MRAGEAAAPTLRIEILDDDWGTASKADIRAVCASAGNELMTNVPERALPTLVVGNDAGGVPITLFKRGANGEIRIRLTPRDAYWSQYAYQFAHELCHVLCDYRDVPNDQKWFEESLCEAASIFVIRRMGESWKTAPPYPNWKSYAASLTKYADDHAAKTGKLDEPSFAAWYRAHEPALRKTGTDRPLNQIVAVHALLPLLEAEPKHWRALGWLNQWDAATRPTFAEYLRDWHARVPDEHKSFVAAVAAKFEILLQ
ncbi:MAG: hypothetical protein QM811_24000 [Pirellulales bacterium]